MQSLTDRMAAALRDELQRHEKFIRNEYEGTSILAEKLAQSDAARAVLAEYDVLRDPPVVTPVPQVGQRVACGLNGVDYWRGTLISTDGYQARVQFDDGEVILTRLAWLRVIPNLPATNTGD